MGKKKNIPDHPISLIYPATHPYSLLNAPPSGVLEVRRVEVSCRNGTSRFGLTGSSDLCLGARGGGGGGSTVPHLDAKEVPVVTVARQNAGHRTNKCVSTLVFSYTGQLDNVSGISMIPIISCSSPADVTVVRRAYGAHGG